MASCKDCMYVEVCPFKHYRCENDRMEKRCGYFKDRSRFVELPCKVSDEFFLLCENSSVFKYTVSCIDIFLAVVSIENVYITLRSDRHSLKITKGRFIYELNKTIFYTKESAEQTLKEGEENA